MQFRHTSNRSHSVTSLVYSMFFQRNSSFFQTTLLRVNSMRFLCYSQPFESFLRPNHTFQLRDWSTLFLWISSLYYSLAYRRHSELFRCHFSLFSPLLRRNNAFHSYSITAPGSTLLSHYRTDHCRYLSSQSISVAYIPNKSSKSVFL